MYCGFATCCLYYLEMGYITSWHLTLLFVNMSEDKWATTGDESSRHQGFGQQVTRPQLGSEFSWLQGYKLQMPRPSVKALPVYGLEPAGPDPGKGGA